MYEPVSKEFNLLLACGSYDIRIKNKVRTWFKILILSIFRIIRIFIFTTNKILYFLSLTSPPKLVQSPKLSPANLGVSRVPLCRLLRCQPVKTRKMKSVSRDSKRIIGHRVFSPFTRGPQIDFANFSRCVKQTGKRTVHTLFRERKRGIRKVFAFDLSIHFARQRSLQFSFEEKKFSWQFRDSNTIDYSNEYKIDILWKRGDA